MAARVVSFALGVWLMVSAFIWPQTDATTTNMWIAGVLVALVTLISTKVPEVRYANTVLAVWLFLSIWALPSISAATTWNNAVAAVGILVASLVPPRPRPPKPSALQ